MTMNVRAAPKESDVSICENFAAGSAKKIKPPLIVNFVANAKGQSQSTFVSWGN